VILVDTSVWVDHLRRRNTGLVDLLEHAAVVCHPFVVGEIACGHLIRREEILALLGSLPGSPVLGHAEALAFLDARRLAGTGVGWVDVHVLGSAVLGGHDLWTLDARLRRAASRLGIAEHVRG
jgi:predicted nucleic acid-binding protein